MKYLLTGLILVFFIACADKKPSVEKETDNKAFTDQAYPVAAFFIQQIKEVDSLKLPTTKYTDENKRKDTVAISLAEFRALAKEFAEIDITEPDVRKHYKETNFADQSIPSITLNYATTNPDLQVQRIDVILDPSPVADDQVKTIYIEKKETNKDTLILKKLYWKSHKNFQVFTTKIPVSKKQIISHVKVAWDDSDQF